MSELVIISKTEVFIDGNDDRQRYDVIADKNGVMFNITWVHDIGEPKAIIRIDGEVYSYKRGYKEWVEDTIDECLAIAGV